MNLFYTLFMIIYLLKIKVTSLWCFLLYVMLSVFQSLFTCLSNNFQQKRDFLIHCHLEVFRLAKKWWAKSISTLMFSLLPLSILVEENIPFQNKHSKWKFSVHLLWPFHPVSRSTATKISYGRVGKVPPLNNFVLVYLKNLGVCR